MSRSNYPRIGQKTVSDIIRSESDSSTITKRSRSLSPRRDKSGRSRSRDKGGRRSRSRGRSGRSRSRRSGDRKSPSRRSDGRSRSRVSGGHRLSRHSGDRRSRSRRSGGLSRSRGKDGRSRSQGSNARSRSRGCGGGRREFRSASADKEKSKYQTKILRDEQFLKKIGKELKSAIFKAAEEQCNQPKNGEIYRMVTGDIRSITKRLKYLSTNHPKISIDEAFEIADAAYLLKILSIPNREIESAGQMAKSGALLLLEAQVLSEEGRKLLVQSQRKLQSADFKSLKHARSPSSA